MMDWITFVTVIAVPIVAAVLLGSIAAIRWVYLDLRASVHFVEQETTKALAVQASTANTELAALRLQVQALQLELVKGYVAKEEVLRLETKILEAIGKLDAKVERMHSAEGR